jgi:aldose 1-epimerase
LTLPAPACGAEAETLDRRLHIGHGALSAVVVPELGGGLARLDFMSGGQSLPLLRPEPPGAAGDPFALGMQILVPWSNRISSGGFSFGGRRHELQPNVEGEPFPIHGNGFSRPWEVLSVTADAVTLCLESDGPGPFRYRAGLTYAIQGGSLRTALDLCNTGNDKLPFGLGFHPWFRRTLQTELQARSRGVWQETTQHLPLGTEPVPLLAEWDFSRSASLPEGFINNAFVGWDGRATVYWPDTGLQLRIEASPVLSTYILYSPGSQADFFCFEPVSHAVDAFNLPGPPEAHGLVVLAPGQSMAASVTLSVAMEAGGGGS